MGILEIRAEDAQTNQQEWQTRVEGAIKTRIDFAGTFITAINSGPADASLAVGELALWYDVANDKFKIKARKNSTTILVGELTLVAP